MQNVSRRVLHLDCYRQSLFVHNIASTGSNLLSLEKVQFLLCIIIIERFKRINILCILQLKESCQIFVLGGERTQNCACKIKLTTNNMGITARILYLEISSEHQIFNYLITYIYNLFGFRTIYNNTL